LLRNPYEVGAKKNIGGKDMPHTQGEATTPNGKPPEIKKIIGY